MADYATLPPAKEHPVFETAKDRAKRLKEIDEETKKLVEVGTKLRKRAQATQVNGKIKREYKAISDEVRRYITNEFKVSKGDLDPKRVAQVYNLNPNTVRKYIEKLKKGESIERSTTKRGRHKIIGEAGAKILYDAYNNKAVHSDKEAAELLKQNGINCSRQTVQKFVTDGTMEKFGYHSLTVHKVSFRGKGSQSEQNKEERLNAVSLFFSYMHANYHPVFIDETHWTSGWKWNRQRGTVGKKVVCDYIPRRYTITAISAISDIGPIYTLVFASASVTGELFSDYMRELLKREENRKVVFFLDNAPVHMKEVLEPMVKAVKDKEIVFNAPYSPECNPIEKFFAEWKRRVQNNYDIPPSQEEMVHLIEKEFFTFTADYCLDLINDLRNNVLDKVVNKEDV